MSKMIPCLAAHPLPHSPYNKLVFVKHDHNRVPLYRVEGLQAPATGAFEALSRAFQRYGGKCFYCRERFEPQAFAPTTAHRDHVIAESAGGSDLLHNLVIACCRCDTAKGADTVHDFRPKAAKAYLSALEKHVARCIKAQLG